MIIEEEGGVGLGEMWDKGYVGGVLSNVLGFFRISTSA